MSHRPDDGPSPEAMRLMERRAREAAAGWGVELGPPYALSRYSYVAPAGPDAVVKVTWDGDDESDHEADALELWAGDGAVRLLRRDAGRRALLAERAVPGTDISLLPDDEATAVAIDLGRRLWRPAGAPFRWIGDHVPRWLDNAARRGAPLAQLARSLYDGLDVGRSTLVHGDFHHHNLLADGEHYLAIDPKPMLGEPEYDVYSFLVNPLGSRMRLDVTERRLSAFAAAGLDEGRMRTWAVIRGAYLSGDDHVEVLRALL